MLSDIVARSESEALSDSPSSCFFAQAGRSISLSRRFTSLTEAAVYSVKPFVGSLLKFPFTVPTCVAFLRIFSRPRELSSLSAANAEETW